MPHSPPLNSRRTAIAGAVMLLVSSAHSTSRTKAKTPLPEQRWYDAANDMKRLAESLGDQPYGAVLVLDGKLVGEAPSRVINNQNPDAHAEREAIHDAQRRLGRTDLSGAVLYSTSRPCSLCEAAAAQAAVSRMYFGSPLADGGAPRQPR